MRVVASRSSAGGTGVRVGRSEEGVELRLREVGDEAAERVALRRCGQRLAHDGRADHHAQRVEGDFGLIAVRVADQARLQDAVVVASTVTRLPSASRVSTISRSLASKSTKAFWPKGSR
jgi:hypothetical protein